MQPVSNSSRRRLLYFITIWEVPPVSDLFLGTESLQQGDTALSLCDHLTINLNKYFKQHQLHTILQFCKTISNNYALIDRRDLTVRTVVSVALAKNRFRSTVGSVSETQRTTSMLPARTTLRFHFRLCSVPMDINLINISFTKNSKFRTSPWY